MVDVIAEEIGVAVMTNLESLLARDWAELFPGEHWPGDAAAGARLAQEVRALRQIADAMTSAAFAAGLPPMRPQPEVQRAHDLLCNVALNEAAAGVVDVGTRARLRLIASLDALCWVLRHEHNPRFGQQLATIETRLRSLGLVVRTEEEAGLPYYEP
jgi:hypothetical protein